MHTFRNAAAAAAAVAITTAAHAQTPADLTWDTNTQITDVINGGIVSIGYNAVITNIGDDTADLEGPTASTTDDVAVQSYLSDDPNGINNRIAAGGFDFPALTNDPTVLGNSDTASAVFSANSAFLPDPANLNGFDYLVLEIINTQEPADNLDNNTLVLLIPSPASATLIPVAALAATRRRR